MAPANEVNKLQGGTWLAERGGANEAEAAQVCEAENEQKEKLENWTRADNLASHTKKNNSNYSHFF